MRRLSCHFRHLVLFLVILLAGAATARASGNVVISQIYGGGGNVGSTYRNDFVELFNRSNSTVSLNGASVQYASTSGLFFNSVLLTGFIPAGGYYLIKLGGSGGGTTSLPFADATGFFNIDANSGVVALVAGTTFISSCGSPAVVDLVGYGSSFLCNEGGLAAPTLSNTASALRKGNGCQDLDFNSLDFATGFPQPFNSFSPLNICSPPPSCGYSLSTLSASGPATGGTGTVTVTTSAGCAWTATSNASFVAITAGSSGLGSGTVTYEVTANPSTSQRTGTLTVAGQLVSITQAGAIITGAAAPFGNVDTPVNNATGISGSLAVTGWALDDAGVTAVRIVRDAVTGEAPGQKPIGNATMVAGARPDVASGFPSYPNNTRAGWGYLMLTNFLPNAGTGTYTLYAYADDANGHSTLLGTRTITCTNSTATTPFGAIDTPGQGETVSGVVANFGWVLSPGLRRADPPGGGSVTVFVDGQPVGTPAGWVARSDLTALFPAAHFSGINSALAVYGLDTTSMSNGVHTIAWGVADSVGGTAGVGSRFFTVSNGPGLTGSLRSFADVRVQTDRTPLRGRRGFDLSTPYREYRSDLNGQVTIQSEEIDRIELLTGASEGFMRFGDRLDSLPIGSHLDRASGTFTWQPGAGFVGTYDFVFVNAGRRRDVRIVLNPKGSNPVGTRTVIDAPTAQAAVGRPFFLAGWAADVDSSFDTGIDAVHVWAYPVGAHQNGAPIFIGAADYGGPRPDVAAAYGEQFNNSGYGIGVQLEPGTYDLAVFAYSRTKGDFVPAKTVRVNVR